MTIPEIISVAKAKTHFSELLKKVCQGAVYEVINHSEPMVILMSVERYKALLERLEDQDDGLFVMQGRLEDYEKVFKTSYEQIMKWYWEQEAKEGPISLGEFRAKYLAEHPDAFEEGQSSVQGHNN